MRVRWMSRSAAAVAGVLVWLGLLAGAAAALTPGWECIPTMANQPVLSGGTGSGPSCPIGTTAVLAPTFISSGAGGKPTVQFGSVNVQIVSGSGTTDGKVNGEGNLVLGYDENSGGGAQTGSHDLIVGRNHSYTGYAQLVAGFQNTATGNYATVLGVANKASGAYATVTGGGGNTASALQASVGGGIYNMATTRNASVTGGCSNIAGTGTVSINGVCNNSTTYPNAWASVSGGIGNQALNNGASVSGGQSNTANALSSTVTGGCSNIAGTGAISVSSACTNTTGFPNAFTTVAGGEGNQAASTSSSVLAGQSNVASGLASVAAGGEFNTAADPFSAVIAGCDNITGTGTNKTSACGAGGEGDIGGASIKASGTDGTFGLISDTLNESASSDHTITLDVSPNACGSGSLPAAGAQVGDVPAIAYGTAPPAGLLIELSGITTTGHVNIEWCNVTAATIHYDNAPTRVMTFR